MSDYGVSDTGFSRKPKTVTITELGEGMQAQFGQDLDIDAESPEGQIISVIADAADSLWEIAEYAYNAYNPNSATGVTLENLVQLNNLTLQEATASTVTLTFSGIDGTNIPEGTIISSDSDLTSGTSYKFTTEVECVISSGVCNVLGIADDVGAIQIPIGSMTLIDTPIVGITSVTNSAAGNVGTEDETDPELRSRRSLQVALPAVSTIDSIYAGILNVDTVLSARVYENSTALDVTEDGVTISPHSLRIIVQGDETEVEKEEIANAIYIRKDPGIQTEGDISYSVEDTQGFDHTFNWDNPTLVPIYITINTEATSSTALSNDGGDIRDAIVAYIEDSSTGYTIGDDVSFARLFTPINSIEGHNVQSIYIGESASPTETADIDINGSSLAVITDPDNDIIINITY